MDRVPPARTGSRGQTRAAYTKIYHQQPFVNLSSPPTRNRASTHGAVAGAIGIQDGYQGDKADRRGSSKRALWFVAALVALLICIISGRSFVMTLIGSYDSGNHHTSLREWEQHAPPRRRGAGADGDGDEDYADLSLRRWHHEGGRLRGALSSKRKRERQKPGVEDEPTFTRVFSSKPLGFQLRSGSGAGSGGGGSGGAKEGSVVTGVADASRGDGGRPIRVGDRVLALQGQNTLRWSPAQLQLALAETDPPMSLLFAAADATGAQVAAALVKAEREREAHADESVSADGTFKVRFDARPLGIALTSSDSGKAGVSVGAVHRRVPPVRVGDLLLAVNGFKVVSWSVEKLVDELDELHGSLTMLFARPEISRADLARATVKSEKSGKRNGLDTPGGKGRTAGTYEYTVKSLPLGISFKDLGGTTGASVGVVTRGFTPIVPGDLVASVNGHSVASWTAKKVSEHIDTLKPPIKVLFATPDISMIELAVAIKHAYAPEQAPSDNEAEASTSNTDSKKKIGRTKSVVLVDL